MNRVVHFEIPSDDLERAKKFCVGEILDIPGVGCYARVQDTEGNVIGVIKPTMP